MMDCRETEYRKYGLMRTLPGWRFLAGMFLLLAALVPGVCLADGGRRGAAQDPDAECLACHSQPDLKSEKGQSVYVNPAKHKASVHADVSCVTCHTDVHAFPHPAKVKKVQCSTCHTDEAAAVPQSVHSALEPGACQTCHGSAHEAQPAAKLIPRLCTQCHESEVKQLQSSVHGAAAKNGDSQSPSCEACHGSIHSILAADNPKSTIAKTNLPDTCGACHSNPEFLAKHKIPFAHPVESYRSSVHGRAVAAGNAAAATCSDCHGSHDILPDQDARSPINHWNVPKTCSKCHSEVAKIYQQSIHGQAVARGSPDAPVCTDCHGEHRILAPQEPASLVNPARVSTVTCGRCHGNELLDARYNLPSDRVPSYADSYHGLESRAGGQTVANCASCHGVHNILPSSDPLSTINPANLAKTCGKCHPGAGTRFAIGPVHVLPTSANETAAARLVRLAYWMLIPLAVGFMLLHHLLDFLKKLRRAIPRSDSGAELPRMNLHFRVAHWMVMASFPVLVVTGFALKFPDAWWAQPFLIWESKFAFRGLVHRLAGVVLLAALGYHAVHLLLVRRDRAILRHMIPGIGDARELIRMLAYNLGLAETRPTFGKFNYVEKIEYLAFVWGTAVMAATGFTLWFNNVALRYFPKWVSDAATALHYYEAILATLAILIWHMYTVVFDPDVYPMDRAWLTGKTSADHLRHTRPEYYEELRKLQEREEKQRHDREEKQAAERAGKQPQKAGDIPPGSPPGK